MPKNFLPFIKPCPFKLTEFTKMIKNITIVCLFILATINVKAQKLTFTNTERSAIVKALHKKFQDETSWKFIVRIANRQNNWAIIKATPQQKGNNYETMFILIKQNGKTWDILEIEDPTDGEPGNSSFAKICIKKYPKIPRALFVY